MRLRCHFTYSRWGVSIAMAKDGESYEEFRDGFMLEHHGLCWIPPSQINLIEVLDDGTTEAQKRPGRG